MSAGEVCAEEDFKISAAASASKQDYCLSIIMPAHNEQTTILKVVKEILSLQVSFDVELIIVDDGSTDETPRLVGQISDERVIVYRNSENLGKGAAVLKGAALATGTHLVVFDADHEYLASDLVPMFSVLQTGRATVVFGARIFGMNTVYQSFRYALGNRVTTLVANIIFDSCLADLHTCLKMMPITLFRQLQLDEKGFGLDSEITAELLRRGYRPFEVPVSYHSRSHAQGKKLTWRDGVGCLVVLSKVRMRGKLRCVPEPADVEAVVVDGHTGDQIGRSTSREPIDLRDAENDRRSRAGRPPGSAVDGVGRSWNAHGHSTRVSLDHPHRCGGGIPQSCPITHIADQRPVIDHQSSTGGPGT